MADGICPKVEALLKPGGNTLGDLPVRKRSRVRQVHAGKKEAEATEAGEAYADRLSPN